MTRADELAQKRHQLQMQCALQRQELAHIANDIEARLVSTDRVIDVVSSVARNPAALIAVIAGTMILGPWRIMKWVGQGMMLFNVAKRLQQFATK